MHFLPIFAFLLQGDDKSSEDGKKKKNPSRTVELPIEARVAGLSQQELDTATEKEVSLHKNHSTLCTIIVLSN